MKKILILEVLKHLQQKPLLMRKLKIFIAISVVGVLITGALVVWAGFAALSFVSSKANLAANSLGVQEQIETLQTEVQGITRSQILNCWQTAQGLIAVQPWIEHPASDHLKSLKAACLAEKSSNCWNGKCDEIKKTTPESADQII